MLESIKQFFNPKVSKNHALESMINEYGKNIASPNYMLLLNMLVTARDSGATVDPSLISKGYITTLFDNQVSMFDLGYRVCNNRLTDPEINALLNKVKARNIYMFLEADRLEEDGLVLFLNNAIYFWHHYLTSDNRDEVLVKQIATTCYCIVTLMIQEVE